jgi:hypothetical protein
VRKLEHLMQRWGKLAYLFGDKTVTVDGPDGQSTTIAKSSSCQ